MPGTDLVYGATRTALYCTETSHRPRYQVLLNWVPSAIEVRVFWVPHAIETRV